MKIKTLYNDFHSDYVRNILQARGVTDVDTFLNPTADCLQSPWDLDNMREAVELFNEKVKLPQPKFLLLADCDCDGFTSAAIIYNYITTIWNNVNIKYLIHDAKQHGLSDKVEWILDNGLDYDLLIVTDAGSNDYGYIEQLKDINLPVLILDHHIVETDISSNCILVNNQASSKYINKDLSGAGVALQFCRALDSYYGYSQAEEFMDLAALGDLGDMMSALSTENQYLWRIGFRHINNYFFQTLCKKQAFSITKKVDATWEDIINKITPISVAFYIVPLINAMIRVGTLDEKERMFIAFIDGHRQIECHKRGAKGTYEEAAIESTRECVNAKSRQDVKKVTITDKLSIKILNQNLLENKVLFIELDGDDDFSSEMNGIIAMQCAQKYMRPTIVARLNNEGYVRGSARGLNQSEVNSFRDFLLESGQFEYATGHDNAFGISIKETDISKFIEYANENLKDVDFTSNIYFADILRDVNSMDILDIIDDITKYDFIWGQRNDAPLIAIENIQLNRNDIQVMGANKNTFKFVKNGVAYIKFNALDDIAKLNQCDTITLTVIGEAYMNEYNGKFTPQIQIKDMEIHNNLLDF